MAQPHVVAYKHLQIALEEFERQGGNIQEPKPPKGATKWIRERQAEVEAERQRQATGDDDLVSEVGSDKGDNEVGDSDDGGDNGLEHKVRIASIFYYYYYSTV
jgi:hypothetical protein